MALTLPIAGDSTRRGSGASFSSGCLRCLLLVMGDVLRFLSKKNDVWFPKLKPVPVLCQNSALLK